MQIVYVSLGIIVIAITAAIIAIRGWKKPRKRKVHTNKYMCKGCGKSTVDSKTHICGACHLNQETNKFLLD